MNDFAPKKKRSEQKKGRKNRIKSWLNGSRMEIKTAEIVRGESGERESEREKHQQKTTMREKLGISCCVL